MRFICETAGIPDGASPIQRMTSVFLIEAGSPKQAWSKASRPSGPIDSADCGWCRHRHCSACEECSVTKRYSDYMSTVCGPRGKKSTAGDLQPARFYRERRINVLWGRPSRTLQPSSVNGRQDPERHEAGQLTGGAAEEVRVHYQPQSRKADRPDDSTECAGESGSGDQVTTGARLELVERKPKGAGAVNEPVVIAGERYGLSLLLEKVNRRQMKGIQHSNRLWKGLQCPRQHGRSELYQRQPTEQRADFIRVRSRQFARVNSRPNLVLDQPARDQRFLPEAFRWGAVFGQKMRQRDRSIEINQRSLRSCSSSFWTLRKEVTGF